MSEKSKPVPAVAKANAPFRVGLLAASDRAHAGVYADRALPAMREWLNRALQTPWTEQAEIVPDNFADIRSALLRLLDERQCNLVLTSGGTGPAPRDVTPEAVLSLDNAREMPGFGEQMRRVSLRFVPTAILSRQVAVVRNNALVVNLPGQPKAVAETLDGVFAAVPYCLDLIGAPRLETNPEVVAAFRPKSAQVKS